MNETMFYMHNNKDMPALAKYVNSEHCWYLFLMGADGKCAEKIKVHTRSDAYEVLEGRGYH